MKILFLFLLLLASIAQAGLYDTYGALAVNPRNYRQYGITFDQTTAYAAASDARTNCGWPKSPCTVVFQFKPGACVAYAVDDAGRGLARGVDEAESYRRG